LTIFYAGANLGAAIEGEEFLVCFTLDIAPVGGNFIANVISNPDATPSKTYMLYYIFMPQSMQHHLCQGRK
jgi:hypothetical protein